MNQMALVSYYFLVAVLFQVVLAQRVGRRRPRERRAILPSLASASAWIVGYAVLAAGLVLIDYADADLAVACVAATAGMFLGGIAGDLLADARRRRSGATD